MTGIRVPAPLQDFSPEDRDPYFAPLSLPAKEVFDLGGTLSVRIFLYEWTSGQ